MTCTSALSDSREKQRDRETPSTRTARGAAVSALAIGSGPRVVHAAGRALCVSLPQPPGRTTSRRIAPRRMREVSDALHTIAAMPPLAVADPLAHRALEALMRAEAHVRRSVAAELQ